MHEDFGDFSFVWAGAIPGESLITGLQLLSESSDILEVRDKLLELGQWKSVPMSVVLGDTSGNIGYMLLSASPVRKNEYPYLGCHVIDGTNTDHDWEGIVDINTLPMGFNPKKGFYVTANNRVVPENSKYDLGAAMIATARANRITELITNGIKEDKKI